ncbi:ASST-domain-containing protein, partial [Delphinella strobiligena]
MSLVYRANEYILPNTPGWAQETIGATVQTCNGTDYLTWWAGKGLWGRKAGRYYITNNDYELVYNFSAIGLEYGDAHEFVLTPQCTALITSYQQRSYDLTMYNITDGWLLDSYFQEIDLATNELLFEWRASDHIKLEDSYLTTNMSGQGKKEWDGWDYFHINSVEKDLRGNYLISSRHMHALYYIDGKTGETKWTLGGKSNEFKDLSEGKAIDFAWQHHARWVSENLTSISLFDNRNSKYVYADDPVSRGMIIDLDVTARSVSLAAEYRAPDDIVSIREGSMQLLSDTPGNAMVGWGNEPGFTEYSANGTILFDVRLGPLLEDRGTADNYRALKVNWTGSPTWAPKIAAGSNKTSLMLPLALSNESLIPIVNDTAFFSWNGATDLAKWIILTSSNSSHLNATSDIWKTVSKSGFESSIWI